MKIKKKVLFTAHVDSHILAFHIPYLKMFQEKGYEVHVASHGDAEVPYADVKFNVPIERSPLKLNNLRSIKQLKSIIDRENYDIIHTHTPMGSVVTRLAALGARKHGTRVIYTAHGFHFFKDASVLNWLVYYPIEKLLAYKTDDLITGVDPKKFDFKFTKADKTKLRKELGLKDSDFVMIYPAELNKNKNQTMLIEVIERLVQNHPDVHLLLPGKDSLDGFHARLAEEKGLENNIHFLGFRKDIPQLLKISDLAVSSSKREGLPVNIIEAMTVGLPVVATSCRGAAELVKDGENGRVVEIDDVDGMAEAIELYVESQKAASKAKMASLEISRNYDLTSTLRHIKSIYKPDRSKSEPIRVLQVVTLMNRAGLETMLMNYYRHIDRTKVQFDFLVHRAEKGDYDDEILSLGGKIHHFNPMGLRSMLGYSKKMKQFLLKHPEYKIVHSHIDALSALPLRGARLAGIPVRIAHSHVNGLDVNFKLPVRCYMKTLIPHEATHLAACSEEAGRFMFGNRRKVTIIKNAIDIRKFKFNEKVRNKVRKELGIVDCITVGHVGRFSKAKNHRFLIELFAEMKHKTSNTKLLLVGAGATQDASRRLAERLGIEKDVIFLGLRNDIHDLMQAMDVFVLPSFYEGLGIVGVEAQASGLPCVLSDKVSSEVKMSQSCSFLSLHDDKHNH